MSVLWQDEEEEEFRRTGGLRVGSRAKPRFSYAEIKLLLEEVKKNRFIILKKFNNGVSAEVKKQTWAEITERINNMGENQREVRQIMKKWADLKCDGKRRMAALKGSNGVNVRKKNLGPVEKMVHKILLMTPGGDGNSDLDLNDEDSAKPRPRRKASSVPAPAPYSYLDITDSNGFSLPGGASFDYSPLSSPEKDLSGDPFRSSPEFEFDMVDDEDHTMDFDDDDDDELLFSHPGAFRHPSPAPLDPLPDDLLRSKPVHTYSRTNHQHASSKPPPGASSSSSSSAFPSASDTEPPSSLAPPQPPANSSSVLASSSTTSAPAAPASSSSSLPPTAVPPPTSVSSSSFAAPSSSSSSSLLPPNRLSTSGSSSSHVPSGRPGASPGGAQDHMAQVASQSLQQQRAGRVLLASVSRSLEGLSQAVQLLVESQQEFVQQSLLLQRETVDILRDFSNTALTMLRDKPNHGHTGAPRPSTQY
ncbi:uncharacterized protein ACJ7VT_002200 isoform 1-T6 [Polymixia lowei]